MANVVPNVAVTWQGGVPAANGQVTADRASAGKSAQVLYGTATIVLDGTGTTAILDYIDAPNGNSQISFSPSGVIACKSGGNAAVTISACADNGTKNSATVTLSGAGSNAQTVNVTIMLIP